MAARRSDLERTPGALLTTHVGEVGDTMPAPRSRRRAAAAPAARARRAGTRPPRRGAARRPARPRPVPPQAQTREHRRDASTLRAALPRQQRAPPEPGADARPAPVRRTRNARPVTVPAPGRTPRARQARSEGRTRALLAQRRRGQVDRDARARPFQLCGSDARPDPRLRLLARAVGQPDDGERGQSALDVRLDLDPARVDADERVRDGASQHVARLGDELSHVRHGCVPIERRFRG